MCGLVGIYGWATAAERRATVHRMLARVAHRGPDDRRVCEIEDLCLGHARLSVIDLADGGQPLTRTDLGATVVFNGEIYNYIELQVELASRGHRFETASDTEVLLVAYREWGDRCVEHFTGMFAFVIFDHASRRLFGARDRFGKKPLFLWKGARGLAFASELKALLELPDIDRTVDVDAVAAYLEQLYVPEAHCIFPSVLRLPAGHTFAWQESRMALSQFWTPTFRPDHDNPKIGGLDELEHVLRRAVRIRLRSEVPIGVFLSGGIDSSVVALLAAEVVDRPLHTYTVRLDGLPDESESAECVAKEIGSAHTVIQVPAPGPDRILAALGHFDEPFADSSAVPMSLMSEVAKRHVTVILSGDGGDELFGGYGSYQGHAAGVERPSSLNSARSSPVFRSVRARLPTSVEHFVRKLIPNPTAVLPGRKHELTEDILVRHTESQRIHYEPPLSVLLRREWRLSIGRAIGEQRQLVENPGNGLNRVFEYDVRHYLAGDILKKVDMTTMAFGLEARAPLLDSSVADLALSMDPQMKVDSKGTKKPLKALLARRLGEAFVNRRKTGFGAPVATWLKTAGMRAVVGDVLEAPTLYAGAWLDPLAVRKVVRRFYSGRDYLAQPVWTLLALELWSRQFLISPPPRASVRDRKQG